MLLDPLKPLLSAISRGNKLASVPFYLQKEHAENEQIQVLTTRKKTEKLIKVNGEKMNIKLKRTSEEDYKLFNRLVANADRAILEQISQGHLGIDGGSTKTVQILKFIVGKYKNKIESEFKDKQVFLDVYDTAEPKEIAKVISIDNGKSKIVEIRWIVDPFIINEEWDRDFDLDSKPQIESPPRKKHKWEIMDITEEEFNKRRAMSNLDELQEQNPEQFTALLDLVKSGNLNKLIKLADTL
ncbi:MAG: hypothetical protein ACI89T_001864 [Cognaticolwellia sp.]